MPVTAPRAQTHPVALLLVDVINDFDFPEASGLLALAGGAVERIETLLARGHAQQVPIIYVNDNFGDWRSDFRSTVARCCDPSRQGAALVRRLAPRLDDYFVLKPQHSGFYHTPLELLLEKLETEVVILCGFSTNSCITSTAMDAHMRGFGVIVPRDTTAANSARIRSDALRALQLTVHANTAESATIDFASLGRHG